MLKNPSQEMIAAMDAIKTFKMQKKFEQRQRPVDNLQTTISSTDFKEIKNSVVPKISTTPTSLRRISNNNKAHAYYYFPHRNKETVVN